MNESPEVTYVFKTRQDGYSENNKYPREHYYYFHNFLKNYKSNIIEEQDSSILLTIFFDTLRKLTKLPLFTEKYLSFKNIKILKKSDKIVITNQNIYFSLLPIIYILKMLNKETNVFIFAMGINENLNINSKILQKLFFENVDLIFFISKGEKSNFEENYHKYNNKFKYIPFSIDTNFWNSKQNLKQKTKILFVGNDYFRDFKFLSKLVESMPSEEFVIVSSNHMLNFNNFKNVIHINSNFHNQKLTNIQLIKLFEEAYVSIIPLKNSFQPSGQSVALQSMSMKVPVIISKTNGFWDNDNFKNEKNIILVNENNIKVWKEEILNLKNNTIFSDNLTLKAYEVLLKHYDIEKNYDLLRKYF